MPESLLSRTRSVNLSALTPILFAGFCAGIAVPQDSPAAVIDFTGARGDFTVFYDPGSDEWDVVFRERAVTYATGLTDQANQDRPHAAPEDFNFSRLNVIAQTPYALERDGVVYYATAREHTDLSWSETLPDFGMRPRLRDADDQPLFESFTMTLDGFSGPGEFAMFQPDPIFGTNVFAYNTTDGTLEHEWEPWGHTHWHWGFTEPGEYELRFLLQGNYADGTHTGIGSETVHFEVIPEPRVVALLLGLAAAGCALWHRSRRKNKRLT